MGEELYIRWAQSLSELGIVGAKGYPSNEYSAEELEQKKRYIQPIFEAIKNDIPASKICVLLQNLIEIGFF